MNAYEYTFDLLCDIATKLELHNTFETLNESKLFLMEEGIYKFYSEATPEAINEKLQQSGHVLPFKVCGVEFPFVEGKNKKFCAVFSDLGFYNSNSEFRKYGFIFCEEHQDTYSTYKGDFIFSGYGDIVFNARFITTVHPKYIVYYKNNGLIEYQQHKNSKKEKIRTQTSSIKNKITSAFTIFMASVNFEKSYVLDELMPKERTIPSQAEGIQTLEKVKSKPKFKVITPKAIHKKLAEAKAEAETQETLRTTPAPHERRRHIRRLRVASGFKEDRDIVIETCWVGDGEKIKDTRAYKVKLEQ